MGFYRVPSSRPNHACTGDQKNETENAPQPQYGYARAEIGADQSAGNGTDQQGSHQVGFDFTQPKMQEPGYPGEHHRMHNVGPDIHFGRVTIKQQQHHHDDAARAHRRHANQETRTQADHGHTREGLQRGRAVHHPLLNAGLKHEQYRDKHQQNPDRELDEIVYAVSVDVPQVSQVGDPRGGTGYTPYSKREHNLPPHRAFLEVHNAGRHFGEEVKYSVRPDGHNRGHPKAKNQDGQQQHTASQSSQADQRAHEKPN